MIHHYHRARSLGYSLLFCGVVVDVTYPLRHVFLGNRIACRYSRRHGISTRHHHAFQGQMQCGYSDKIHLLK